MKSINDLTKYLEKELEYDGSGGKDCPHCGKNIEEHTYWIDHKSSLSSRVCQFLGFKMGSWDDDGINGLIYRKIETYNESGVFGKAKKDAPLLAKEIMELLYE
jgi:hypothetical protein